VFGSLIQRRIVHEGGFLRCKSKRSSFDQINTRAPHKIIQRRNRGAHQPEILNSMQVLGVVSASSARRVKLQINQ